MKQISWDEEKNILLKQTRGIGFEDVLIAIDEGRVLDSFLYPNTDQHPNQEILIFERASYAYLVPFIENEKEIFLKTIIPSRKMTKKYLY